MAFNVLSLWALKSARKPVKSNKGQMMGGGDSGRVCACAEMIRECETEFTRHRGSSKLCSHKPPRSWFARMQRAGFVREPENVLGLQVYR